MPSFASALLHNMSSSDTTSSDSDSTAAHSTIADCDMPVPGTPIVQEVQDSPAGDDGPVHAEAATACGSQLLKCSKKSVVQAKATTTCGSKHGNTNVAHETRGTTDTAAATGSRVAQHIADPAPATPISGSDPQLSKSSKNNVVQA